MSLNKKEERFIQRWSKSEEKGQYFYTITFGLLWGNGVAFGSKILSSYGKEGFEAAFLTSDFLIKLLIFNLIGLVIYAYKWNTNSKRYKQLKNFQDRSINIQE